MQSYKTQSLHSLNDYQLIQIIIICETSSYNNYMYQDQT